MRRLLRSSPVLVLTLTLAACGGATSAALKALDRPRGQVVVATKVRGRVGPGVNQVGLSRAHVFASIDGSLRRLGLDHVDLHQIHGFDPVTPIEDTGRALDDVVRLGKARYVGFSNMEIWHTPEPPGQPEDVRISDAGALSNDWACLEWLFDGTGDDAGEAAEPRMWLNGNELSWPTTFIDPTNAAAPVRQPVTNFIELETGIYMYQGLTVVTNWWIDDLAVGPRPSAHRLQLRRAGGPMSHRLVERRHASASTRLPGRTGQHATMA